MRILLLTSSTGGGHDTRARAFTAWAKALPELGLTTHQHQALETQHGLYRFGVHLYNFIQRRAPRLHHLYFNYLEAAGMLSSAKKIFAPERFIRLLEEHRPQAILSVHGSLNHGFFQLARRTLGPAHVRCITYCGELSGGYGFSKHWVNPQADLFIGAVEETCVAAQQHGMAPERARVGGFLLDPGFYAPPFTPEQKNAVLAGELGLAPDRFTLLLATGAVGANNHVAFLDALHTAKLPLQVVALCGRNPTTLSAVEHWAARHPALPVRALPYSTRMPALLQSVSAVVARPGTGTTCESILSQCPIIANGVGGIMPQENITVKYGRKHDVMELVQKPHELPRVVKKWLEQPARPAQIKQNMQSIRPRQHPRQILEWVAGIGSSATA